MSLGKKTVPLSNCIKDLYLKEVYLEIIIKKRSPVMHKEGYSFSGTTVSTIYTRTSLSWGLGTKERVT